MAPFDRRHAISLSYSLLL